MPKQTKANPNPWQTQLLRLTLFLSPAAQVVEPTWWRDLVSESPETIISRPREGTRHESGAWWIATTFQLITCLPYYRWLERLFISNKPSSTIPFRNSRSLFSLNRLSKWAVVSGAYASQVGHKDFACRLELDINTVPDFQGELPRESFGQLLGELTELGQEIAQKGDIPWGEVRQTPPCHEKRPQLST